MWRWLANGSVGIWIGLQPCFWFGAHGVGHANSPEDAAERSTQLQRKKQSLDFGRQVGLPDGLLPVAGPVPLATLDELAGRHRWDRFAADSRLAPVRPSGPHHVHATNPTR